MKTILRLAVVAFIVLSILGGCKSDPDVTGYVTPAKLVSQISSADRIVVINLYRNIPGAGKSAQFSTAITGQEMTTMIRAIASLRAPTYDFPTTPSDCAYEWQLQFYRSTKLLGAADLADCLIRCNGVEYQMPQPLKSLYKRIAKESGEED